MWEVGRRYGTILSLDGSSRAFFNFLTLAAIFPVPVFHEKLSAKREAFKWIGKKVGILFNYRVWNGVLRAPGEDGRPVKISLPDFGILALAAGDSVVL